MSCPQAEGLVVDPVLGTLYIAQEDVALWRTQIVAGRFVTAPRMVERTREFGVPATFDEETEECDFDWSSDPGEGGRIASDVEGLTIYRTGFVSGTLLVSSQGDNTFFTYDRLTNRPLSHFKIAGVQDCDGAHVVNTALPGFPRGLLVVHDGDAVEGGRGRPPMSNMWTPDSCAAEVCGGVAIWAWLDRHLGVSAIEAPH